MDTLSSLAGGALAGLVAMIAGPVLYAASHSPLLRLILAISYGLPAGYAGYRIGLSLLPFGSIEGFWLHAAATLAAIATGLTAAIRLTKLPDRQASLA